MNRPHSNGKKTDSARWSRGKDNIARILPRRPITGQYDLTSFTDDDDERYRILIIDPQPLTRNCLVAAMQDTSEVFHLTAVDNIDSVRRLMSENVAFDIIIHNLDQNQINEQSLSTELLPVLMVVGAIPLVLMTSCTTPGCLTFAFQHGVRGYLTIDTSLTTMLQVIRLVSDGWIIFPAFRQDERLPAYAQMQIAPREGKPPVKFTPRQEQVLQCLATGMPNKSIAYHLQMSESTVKAHIKEIMQRVGAANRTQVVALMTRNDNQDG